MLHKKRLLVRVMNACRLMPLFSSLAGDRLIVVNYHRIYQGERPDTCFDEGVFTASLSAFRRQMEWLKRQTRILSEPELVDLAQGRSTFSGLCSLVTFDDGYIDNYLLAYPLLKELGIPAIFFIPTQSISERQLGWWDLISYFLNRSGKSSILLDGELLPLSPPQAVRGMLLERMKQEPAQRTHDLMKRLAEACALPMPDRLLQGRELMTWDQIREVAGDGIAIGCHTHTHRVLATLPESEQREEMLLSKRILEREVGQAVRSIAYPVGGYRHFTGATRSIAAECGFDLGFSFNTGINDLGSLNLTDVRRMEPDPEFEMFTAQAVLPGFIQRPRGE